MTKTKYSTRPAGPTPVCFGVGINVMSDHRCGSGAQLYSSGCSTG